MARLKDPSAYSPSYRRLKEVYGGDERAIRAEYRRVYDIVRKRYKRAVAAGFGRRQVTLNMGDLKPISAIESNRELARNLANAYHYITAETYTLKGQRAAREKALETLIERKKVYKDDYSIADIDLLMKLARKRGMLEEYGSDTVLEEYRRRQKSEKKKSVGMSARTARRTLQQLDEEMKVRKLFQGSRDKLTELADAIRGTQEV